MFRSRSLFTCAHALLMTLALWSCIEVRAQATDIHILKVKSPADLRNYFRYTGKDIPLVSGHRGGMVRGFPENSIATFENTLRHTPAFFEVDPRLTSDSVIVLMHDATLDRTTNGRGKVSDYTWEELKKLNLKDPEGNLTEYRIPTLDEAIIWGRGKTVLNLDKKDVPLEMIARKIREHGAEAHVMLTVHNAQQARFYYEANKDLMFSAFVKTREALEEYEKAGIPWSSIMAYIGPEAKPGNKELVDLLHARGVMCMISAAPTYDKLNDEAARAHAYREIIRSGADVIESDLPIEAAQAVRPLLPRGSRKEKFFGQAPRATAAGAFAKAGAPMKAGEVSIVPRPLHQVPGSGRFVLTAATPIVLKGLHPELKRLGDRLRERIRFFAGYDLEVAEGYGRQIRKKAIVLSLAPIADSLGAEGYQLFVTPASVVLTAREPQGLFYALQSLLQLLPPQRPAEGVPVVLPAVRITDRPAYSWRGMHLDVGRHFFPVEFIKRTIDNLALHKINTFHWHLTEDQGWRIEIKKYPRLTEVGAWRGGTLVGHSWDQPARFDGQRYGGYYTQEQIREVVAYARERFITIVPEIDVPGHSLAALAAYPELSCTGGPFEVSQTWGVFEDVYCAGREETFRFLEDVFSEVADLFPGPVIHIGGDESPKTRWKACARCQARIRSEGLKDEHELQSYFIKRIQQVLHKRGKTIIGWDEILEDGLAPGAAVMSWRGIKGGIAAARQGHEVVMTPNSPLYLDHYQGQPLEEPIAYRGNNTLRKVYDFDPRPAALSKEEARYIKGVQANLWTEYIHTPRHAEYMIFPRLAALAETAWTAPENKSWESFSMRMEALYRRYATLNINFSRSAYQVQPQVQYSDGGRIMQVQLHHDAHGAPIFYTLDGSEPGEQSLRYAGPLAVTGPVLVKAAAFAGGQRQSLMERAIVPNKATGRKIRLAGAADHRSMAEATALVNGIKGLPSSRDRAEWTGFYAKEMVAVLDLDTLQRITRLSASFLQEPCKNIALPDSVEYAVSGDGKTFMTVGVVPRTRPAGPEVGVQEFSLAMAPQMVRYIRVRTRNSGQVPAGEEAIDKKWIYADEILVE